MSTPQARTGLILPDDGGIGGDDTIDVTTQISNSIDYLSNAVGIWHAANFGALPSTGNFLGRLAQTDDTGEEWEYNGGWKFRRDTKWQTAWRHSFKANGVAVNAGATAQKYDRYFRSSPEKMLLTGWQFISGSGMDLKTGQFEFSIPYQASGTGNAPNWGTGSASARGEDFEIFSRIDPNGSIVTLYGLFLNNAGAPSRVKSALIQNADPGGPVGTGIPRFASVFTWDSSNSGYLNWQIEYFYNLANPIATTP